LVFREVAEHLPRFSLRYIKLSIAVTLGATYTTGRKQAEREPRGWSGALVR